MWKTSIMKPLFACLVLAGFSAAQDKSAVPDIPSRPGEKVEAKSANRKAYDALYSDIIKTLPRDGKAKVDSARGLDAKPERTEVPRSPEDGKKKAHGNHKKELDELPPDVKARVDKVLIDLDTKKKVKKTEFKELK
jgi:hypothetical protein